MTATPRRRWRGRVPTRRRPGAESRRRAVSPLELGERRAAGVGHVEELLEVHRAEDVQHVGGHPVQHEPTLATLDATLERDEEADLRAGEVADVAEVEREPPVLSRLDRLVEPVAL